MSGCCGLAEGWGGVVGGRVREFRRGSLGGQDQNQNQVQNQDHVQNQV